MTATPSRPDRLGPSGQPVADDRSGAVGPYVDQCLEVSEQVIERPTSARSASWFVEMLNRLHMMRETSRAFGVGKQASLSDYRKFFA